MYLSGNIQRPNSLLLEHCKEFSDVDGDVLEYLQQTTKEQGEEQINKKQEDKEQRQNAKSLGQLIEQKIILMIKPIENSISLKKIQGYDSGKLELLLGSVAFTIILIMVILVYAQKKHPNEYLSIQTVGMIVISIICALLGTVSLFSQRIFQSLCNLLLCLFTRCLISPSEFQILEKDIPELNENTRRIIKKAIQLIRDSELLLNRLRIGTPSQVIIRLQEALSGSDSKEEDRNGTNIMQQLGDYRQIRGTFEISCMELRQALADGLEKFSQICLELPKKNNPRRLLLVNLCKNKGISTEQLKSQANAFADLVGLLQTTYEQEITQANLFCYLKKLKKIQQGAVQFRVNLKEGLKKQKQCLFKQKEKQNAEESQVDGNEGQDKEMVSLDQKQEFWVKHWKRIQEEFGEESRKYKVIIARLCACKDIEEKEILRQQLDSQMMKVQSLHDRCAEIFLESRGEKKKLDKRSCLEDGNHQDGSENHLAESDDCTVNALGVQNNQKEQIQEDDKETVSVLEANAFDGCNWEQEENCLQKKLNQPQFLSEMQQVLKAKNPQKKEKRIILDTPEERQMNLRRRNQQNLESQENGRMKFFQENSQKSLFAELKGVAFSRSSGLGEEILE